MGQPDTGMKSYLSSSFYTGFQEDHNGRNTYKNGLDLRKPKVS